MKTKAAESQCPTPRQKVYAFLNLPHHVQLERARKLELTDTADPAHDDDAPRLLWIKRAKEKGCIDELLLGHAGQTPVEVASRIHEKIVSEAEMVEIVRKEHERETPGGEAGVCDCNSCRLARGAHPFYDGKHEICTKAAAQPAAEPGAPLSAEQFWRAKFGDKFIDEAGCCEFADAYAASLSQRVRELEARIKHQDDYFVKAAIELTDFKERCEQLSRELAEAREALSAEVANYASLMTAVLRGEVSFYGIEKEAALRRTGEKS